MRSQKKTLEPHVKEQWVIPPQENSVNRGLGW